MPSGTRVKAKTSAASSVPVVPETSRVSQVGFMDLKSNLNDIKANILSLSADIKNLHLPSVQNISAADFTRRSYSSVVGQLRDKSQGITMAADAGARVSAVYLVYQSIFVPQFRQRSRQLIVDQAT